MTPQSWMNDPEAFSDDYAELQQLFADMHEDEIVEGDLCDIVRQYEEGLSDEQRDELNRERESEWMKFYDSGFEFPYEM